MDDTRYFPVPSLDSSSKLLPHDIDTIITSLSSQCWQHYYDQSSNHNRQYHSIYIGSLGPCAFVRYRLALSIDDKKQKLQLLQDAAKAVHNVQLSTESASSSRQRISLLEGEHIGALTLSSAIHYDHYTCTKSKFALMEVSACKREILDIGNRYVKTLPAEECEVLYGRAGYLHVIAFIRSTTNDPDFGRDVVKVIVQQIIHEGQRVAARSHTSLPLMWTWHGKDYLGAIHGVVGILYTLLCFHDEVSLIKGAIEMIKVMTTKLDELCFPTGNLKSSLGSDKDRLVHLCHGSPGHILYLVKAYEVFGNDDYLNRAEEIATSVLCKRGLLKKGVGLCHGVSGNAYCFLSLYRGRRLSEERGGGGEISRKKSAEWLQWAHTFARFAVDNLNMLFGIPERPYSLYEGVSGLIMLLNDLKDPDQSRFPCFEY